ncbi:YcaO-like family protein [Streptomyces sp. ADI96-02]|uniref:YcaO-like family protein n=1 Tax=Streptomyces sp. ADI96-02 TaxID=1522760 RepID=UPI000F9BC05D|nr:YcaO-like family protein [Streptomyces sp. ADI96-02]RPK69291.1 YcaO-like family protein [Streptomyces sp. ADI96-02]
MTAASAWAPQVFAPYASWPRVVLARVAARSPQFDAVCAAGGRPVIVGSAAGHDSERVAASARGELLERVGNVLAGRAAESDAAVVASHRELRRKGIPAVDPAELAPDGGAAALDDAREARRLWVRGRFLRSGADVHVPAGAVFLHHRAPSGCDPGPGAGSTGLAAHPDPEAATRHAAWEVLERDLVRRSWYGLLPGPRVMASARLPEPLAELLDGNAISATALDLPAPAGSRCVAVALHAADGTRQTFGARCGPEAEGVAPLAEKAAYEALMVRWSMKTAVAEQTWARWRGESPPGSAVEHALWAFHRQDSLRLWTARAPRSRGRRETAPAGRHRDGTAVLAEHTGRDPVVVDTTCGPANDLGSTVVRIVAPGARALPTGPDTERGLPIAPGPHPFG